MLEFVQSPMTIVSDRLLALHMAEDPYARGDTKTMSILLCSCILQSLFSSGDIMDEYSQAGQHTASLSLESVQSPMAPKDFRQ